MKTTFDLPPDLVREVNLRAVREGRKLKDVAAKPTPPLKTSLPKPPPGSYAETLQSDHYKVPVPSSYLAAVVGRADELATRLLESHGAVLRGDVDAIITKGGRNPRSGW